MSVPESVKPGASSGLFSSLRSFWSVMMTIIHTRLELLTLELEEEATRAVRLIVVILAGLFCVGMAVFFLMFLLIVVFWEHRVLVLGLVFGASALASVILLFVARAMILTRPRFLSHTLTELRRDAESLRPAPSPTIEEIKP